MEYIRLNGRQLAKKIKEILDDSTCKTIEINVCDGCYGRVKKVRQLLNKCKG